MSYGFLQIGAGTGPIISCAAQDKLVGKLIPALTDLYQVINGEALATIGNLSDLQRASQVNDGRGDRLALAGLPVSLEGFIEMSAPLGPGEPNSSTQYARVAFRASLNVSVDKSGESSHTGSDQGTNQGSAEIHIHATSSPSVDEGDIGISDSTTGGSCGEVGAYE